MSVIQKKDYWPEPPDISIDGLELIPMTLEQVDTIVLIEEASFPIPWSREAFYKDLTSNPLATYKTLLRDGKIIGYAGFWLIDRIAHLTTICLMDDQRGIGLGRWLLLEMMRIGAESGAERFTLEVRESNTPAINLYKSIGYREVGRREQYYREIGEDALIMWTGDPPFEG